MKDAKPHGIHPALFSANYHQARERLAAGLVTGDDIREWFALWAVDKASYGHNDQGQPCELMSDGTWLPLDWIINAP